MEQGFTLPRSALVRPALQTAFAVLGGLLVLALLRPERSLVATLTTAALPVALVLAASWYGVQYKYVWVSSAGVRGRAKMGFKVNAVPWSEPLSAQAESVYGQSGYSFVSAASGTSIFVPMAILRGPEFKAAVSQHAPQDHVLRGEL